jgi:hypothetical protein
MTEIQIQFIEETGVSFDGIPINGVHLEYITWLEAQIKALRIHDVVGQSEQLKCEWDWNHGMMRKKGYASCKKCGLML